ncbi:hypothetical protein [Haladaptatus sp. NG-WS-4]
MSDEYECKPVETSGNLGQLEYVLITEEPSKARDAKLLRLINETRELEKEYNDGKLTDYNKRLIRRALAELTPAMRQRLQSTFKRKGSGESLDGVGFVR